MERDFHCNVSLSDDNNKNKLTLVCIFGIPSSINLFTPYRPVWYVPGQGLYHSEYLGLKGLSTASSTPKQTVKTYSQHS